MKKFRIAFIVLFIGIVLSSVFYFLCEDDITKTFFLTTNQSLVVSFGVCFTVYYTEKGRKDDKYASVRPILFVQKWRDKKDITTISFCSEELKQATTHYYYQKIQWILKNEDNGHCIIKGIIYNNQKYLLNDNVEIAKNEMFIIQFQMFQKELTNSNYMTLLYQDIYNNTYRKKLSLRDAHFECVN